MKYFRKLEIKTIIIAFFCVAAICSCNNDEIYEREQYKVVFALVSDDDHNVFKVAHDLDEQESVGYVVASCGGSNPTEMDTRVTLVQTVEPFNKYNKDKFDVELDKFANRLSAGKFSIDSYDFTIPAGGRSGRMAIKVRPAGLSPDSVYFIPLKVDTYSAYEVNPDKSDVLYQVMIKNRYATQAATTNYTLRGTRDGVDVMGVKQMHPISSNRVRIMAGTDAFQSDISIINSSCIILTVGNDNKVSISPFKNITVEQVDGDTDFPNIFTIDDDGYNIYKTFLLSYKYTLGTTTYTMREELRIKLEEDEKEKFNL
ncbi:MAG: DUF4361 domain-containing protein [Prevotellaceae bacterium]|jgi:hypothetical protein|nr:DUF4361 domain-containing protein [Prevotellaceae bacterium]